jgi:hypothetical protein
MGSGREGGDVYRYPSLFMFMAWTSGTWRFWKGLYDRAPAGSTFLVKGVDEWKTWRKNEIRYIIIYTTFCAKATLPTLTDLDWT